MPCGTGALVFHLLISDYFYQRLPAAGNRNGQDVNNVQNNGNYWSSTANNSNNAYHLNFNDNNLNPQNNNNRYNGYSVRLVQDFTQLTIDFPSPSSLSGQGESPSQVGSEGSLLSDLFRAYYDARRHKRKTHSQLEFELDLEHNLVALYEQLRDRTYRPSSSLCFIISDPKKREVFASSFRDRVVHHLYYNYVAAFCDRQFVYDSYSCRVGKGTLFGIGRLEHHIRSVSRNYTCEAYVLKMDLQGYFMSIPREQLRQRVQAMLRRWQQEAGVTAEQAELVEWLTDLICMKNPLTDCRVRGSRRDWDDLPPSKSLWHSPDGVGLPIGDLTSQLFSNIYLNGLDRYVTDMLGMRHYGRYVDDFYVVDTSRERLRALIEPVRQYLRIMGMTLHPNKIVLQPVSLPHRQRDVPALEFLGALIFPYYRHCTHRTTAKYSRRCREWSMALTDMGTAIKDSAVLVGTSCPASSFPSFGGVGKVRDALCCAEQWQRIWQSWQSYRGYLGHFRAWRMGK